ncbi:MAG TPA: hypothetical protein VNB23_04070, partial [Ramlibacter sp.]|nr:hypothetical protein [Ramlibacter sp.]
DAGGSVRFRGKVDVSSSAGSPPGSEAGDSAGIPRDTEKKHTDAPAQPLPYVPREGQPQEVQAAMATPEAESASYLSERGALAPQDSERKDPYKREVADDGVQCITR